MDSPAPIALMVKITRNMDSIVVTAVLARVSGCGAVRANKPKMAWAAKLPGTMGMHPAAASALVASPNRARSSRPAQPTTAAAVNEAVSRFQPASCANVRVARAVAPLAAHQGSSRHPKLNIMPKPLAAKAPNKAW